MVLPIDQAMCPLRRAVVLYSAVAIVLAGASVVTAQSTTYHLHRETSSTSGLFQLKTASPDASSLTIQSANLKNLGAGEYIVKAFDTQSGVPGLSGTIPSGSTLNLTVWMRKTASAGVMYPHARVQLNSSAGTTLCQATGTTALTTTMTSYALSCTTGAAISATSSDRFYLWAGVNMTTGPGAQNQRAELNIEGTLNGNFDSNVQIPDPTTPPPSISMLAPNSGVEGEAVTVSGSNFGSSQGASTVTFNGTVASVSSWSATSIGTTVPAGAASGPVAVTVGGQASSGVTFTVLPNISSLSASSGPVGQAVTISGTSFGASQGASTVTFNGVSASVTSWSNTSLSVTVPPLAATGPVVVTTSAGASSPQVFVVPTGVTHSYDALGRLVGTVDPTGASATFVYDAVGNLLSIQRSGSGTVSVVSVSPATGPVGTAVTVSGTGFSAVPSQNTVLFNGVQATVTASTATQLSVTVPAGATTGSVNVTAPAGAAAGGPFTVTSVSAPTISGFTPAIATAGSSVSINGTNFSTAALDNRVQFNETFAAAQTATATTLGTTVPDTATSGHITVATAMGLATSADDLFVPPPPHVASDVLVTHRMSVGGSYTVTLGTPGKIGLIIFDATAGQRVSVWGTNGIYGQIGLVCDVDVTLLRPGVPVAPVCMEGSGFIDATTLPVASTHTLLVDPASTATGSVTLNLYDVPPDIPGTIVPGGAPVTVTMTAPGQNALLTFAGTAGQRIALNGTNGLTGQAGALCDVLVTIRKPDTTEVTSPACMEGSGFIDTVTLPATGTYSILVNPALQATGSLTLTLYDVPADITGTLTFGTPVTVTTTAPGQNGVLTFTGTPNQRISLVGTNGMSGQVGITCDVDVAIKRPNGALLTNTCMEGSGFIEAVSLPDSGTYSVLVDPAVFAVGSLTLTLYDVPADVTGEITPGGSSVPVTITAPGQNAVLTFNATALQRVSLLTEITSGAFGCAWGLTIRRVSDNFFVGSVPSCGAGAFLEPVELPTTASYKIEVNPAGIGTGTASLTLYDVVDATGSIAINGSAVGVSLLTPGQQALLTFSGTSGQSVTASATVTSGAYGCAWSLAILNSAGGIVASNVSCSSGNSTGAVSLPASGTYTVRVDPAGTATGAANVSLTSP